MGRFYSIVDNNKLSLSESKRMISHLYGYYSFDNLDDFYYPTKGAEIYAEASLVQDTEIKNMNPVLHFKYREAYKLSKKFTLQWGINARSIIRPNIPVHLGNVLVAKEYEQSLNYQLVFQGLPTLWATQRSTIIANTSLRMSVVKNHYLILTVNGLLHNNELNRFNEYDNILGGGLTYLYKSAFGPIELTCGYSDEYKKPVVTANIGFWF
jgi:NTE family protein